MKLRTTTILLACEIFPPDIGGPATYAHDFMEWAQERHPRVQALAFGNTLTVTNMRTISREGNAVWRLLRYFIALLRLSRNTEVIYAMGPLTSGLLSVIAGKLFGARVVIRVPGDRAWETAVMHGSSESFEEFQTKWHRGMVGIKERVQCWALTHAHGVIAQSEMWRGVLIDWGVTPKKIHVIPNPHVYPLITHHDPFDQPTNILAVGRLVPWKRFDDLIHAFSSICSDIPDSKLIIVGAGPEKHFLEHIKEQQTCKHRILIESVTDKYKLMQYWAQASILVLPSSYEGFSNTILESWSAGVPVVASDTAGNRELIREGENGFLFPLHDIQALSHALLRVMKDPILRARIIRNAQSQLVNFDKDIVFNRVYNMLFNNAL